ncbi:MAG: hypothetical protein HKN47_17180 [Pirellulaceae bacterium]|nr:hypothetical protein [Pirellulaceae bacterium]
MNMRIFAATIVITCMSSMAGPSHAHATGPMMQVSTSVARAVMKFFGKEGSEEAAQYMARHGGKQMVQRVTTNAARQGDEAVEQVARIVSDHGPDALRALDNAPSIGPVLSALDEIPEAQMKTAIARLAAGSTGRELAQTISKHGSKALAAEIKHPGVGMILVRSLGDDGAELAGKLSSDQAITLAKHADDLARLPAPQRTGVLAMFRNDTERMAGFVGDFVKANPGKSLFTVATTTVILAEPERILGGDEIVLDADGNPIVVSKSGIVGRSIEATGKAAKHVSDGYIRPLFLAVIAFLGTFAVLWSILKLWHVHRRETIKTRMLTEQSGETIDAKSVTATESKKIAATSSVDAG